MAEAFSLLTGIIAGFVKSIRDRFELLNAVLNMQIDLLRMLSGHSLSIVCFRNDWNQPKRSPEYK